MTHLVQRRLQVFVSSTYTDLVDVRQAAVEAVLSCDHIPAGMELFTAGDDSQMDVIQKWIDQSDVYLLILGGRYGSLHPQLKKSYTQLEFEYAVKKGIPHFACVMTEECLKKRVKEHEHGTSYIETDNAQKLTKFRRTVTSSRVVSFWNDTNELKLAILKKLNELQRDSRLTGWIRADSIEATSPAVLEELARLSRENSDLKEQISKSNNLIGGISYDKLSEIVFKNEKQKACFFAIKQRLLSNSHFITTSQTQLEEELLRILLELNLIHKIITHHGTPGMGFNENGRMFVSKLTMESHSTE